MNTKVYNALRRVEFVSTDAASSEILGVKMLQRGTLLDGENALCPSLRVHTRDKAHATKRILKRPFDADPYLKGIVDRFVMGKTTLLSKIHNSADFTDQFKQSCKRRKLAYTPLALAKHRFSCLRKGLVAHVQHLLPLLDCAKYMLATRDRKESAIAHAYCEETVEVRVQVRNIVASRTD